MRTLSNHWWNLSGNPLLTGRNLIGAFGAGLRG
jgi:hypothetical protein